MNSWGRLAASTPTAAAPTRTLLLGLLLLTAGCTSEESAPDAETSGATEDAGGENSGSNGRPSEPSKSTPTASVDAGNASGSADSGIAPTQADAGLTPVANADSLSSFSDDFETGVKDGSWQVLNGHLFDWQLLEGQLVMQPRRDPCDTFPFCVWFEAAQGPGLVKLIAGNFMVTSRVRARAASDPAAPPQSPYLFAGLIARDPRSDNGPENYVFTVIGHREHLTNETKNTINDSSRVGETGERENTELDLRICRVAQRFLLLNRELGTETWVETARFDRTEQPLSTTLQVGAIVYNFDTAADVVGQFDHITFSPLNSFADCAN